MYKIAQLTPKQYPKPGRNTFWANGKERRKHIKYRRHLTINDKEYYQITNNNGIDNRKNRKETCLPNCELLIGNGRI